MRVPLPSVVGHLRLRPPLTRVNVAFLVSPSANLYGELVVGPWPAAGGSQWVQPGSPWVTAPTEATVSEPRFY